MIDDIAAEQNQARRIPDLAEKTFVDAKLDTIDGCRLDFDEGRLHIRAGSAEPVTGVTVEARDARTIRKYLDAVLKIRNETLS